ncbi:MAG TPA: Holliday junction resolvase RuvX [Rhodospirillaceae bacterium]|nr:MAG: hypothetical protein A2018_03935 [Alphaproteobacteria bacterium GWF2_58_20]HAU29698.1 Holliday junction resolvase RuvX [Rhodospirillaceae bacterium]
MPIFNLQDMKTRLKPGTRLVGLDVGDKTIGIAISDSGLTLASPVMTVMRKDWAQDLAAMAKVFKDRQVGGIIVGLPLNMDDSEGPRCTLTRKFANKFLADWKPMGFTREPPLAFEDERLSTFAAKDSLMEGTNLSRRKKEGVIDMLAATHILQGAIKKMP